MIKGVYLVTDEHILEGKDMFHVIEEAAKGGVSMVQLRQKNTSTRDYVSDAIRIKEILQPYDVPLIINDRIDVALASNADGVHIGQSDMDYITARRLMGKDKIIGLSVESKEQVLEAEGFDVDYIAASPVYDTPTKNNTLIEWGLDGLRWIRQNSRHRLVAIGGINKNNVCGIVNAGAESVAVVSAIILAEDIITETQKLNAAFDKSL